MIRRAARLAADCALWCVAVTYVGTIATLGACIGGVYQIATRRPPESMGRGGD